MLKDQIQILHIFSNFLNTLQASCEGLGKAIYRILDSNGALASPGWEVLPGVPFSGESGYRAVRTGNWIHSGPDASSGRA